MPVGIRQTRDVLSRRETSVLDHVTSTLTAIHATDPDLGAFFSVADDAAIRAAEAADAALRERGNDVWRHYPLLGVTVAVKDLIQTEDLPTTRGSLLRNPHHRADSPAVARIRAAGAIIVGKTATSEHGWSASTASRLARPTRNPWSPDHSAGGSSGGSAAAVSAGLCTAALGTDGAGSIRIPAAFSGVVGFKPSFGRVPYVPGCADRLAHLGPLATNVSDVAELTEVLRGPHAHDPDSALDSSDAPRDPSMARIGWVEFPGTSGAVRRVGEHALTAVSQEYRVDRIDVPFADPYGALVDILAASEAASSAPEDDPWCDSKRIPIIRHGRGLSAAAVLRAEETRLNLRSTLRSVMQRYDLLAMPTVPVEPFGVDAIGPRWAADPQDLLWLAWTPATYPFNMTGQPAVSLPAGLTEDGLPVGLQLVGPVGADDLVLTIARRVEAKLGPLRAFPSRPTERML